MAGLLSCVTRDEIIDYCLKMVETSLSLMRKKSEVLDHPVLYHVVIIDMSGLSLQASSLLPLVRMVRSFLRLYEGPVSVSHRAQGPKKLEIGNKKIKLPTIKVYDRINSTTFYM